MNFSINYKITQPFHNKTYFQINVKHRKREPESGKKGGKRDRKKRWEKEIPIEAKVNGKKAKELIT